jgi:hypothetical protein
MYVLPTQNANIISVLVTGSSYTNVVFKHKPFEKCGITWKICCEINSRWKCPCTPCELSGEWAGPGAGEGRRKGDIPPKNFDFDVRVKVTARVEATAAGKLPHVHSD